MFKPVSLLIGLRYTRAKRQNHFISFISLTSIIGLTLGVAVLITVLSVMNGFDRELRTRILGMVPHASLTSREPFRHWEKLADFAKKNPQVLAVAPFSQLQGMLTAHGEVAGALITGIDPGPEKQVSIVSRHMIRHSSIDALQPGDFGIVLGSGLASALNVSIGDFVTLVMPESAVSPAGVIPRFKRMRVVGIFQVGADVDGMLAYVNIADAGKMLRIDDKVQGIRLKMKDIFAAPTVAQSMLFDLPDSFTGNVKLFTDLFERVVGIHFDAKSHAQHFGFARGERIENVLGDETQTRIKGGFGRRQGRLIFDEIAEM